MEQISRSRLNAFYFFCMGLFVAVSTITVEWVATEDILSGTKWSTTIIMVAFSLPSLIGKVLCPFIVRRLSFLSSMIILTLLLVGAVLLIVLIENVNLRIVGVGIHGAAYSFGQVTCYSMLSYYENADELAMLFCWAQNVSAILSSLGYTGITTWLCVPPRIAVAGTIPLCLMPIFFYALLDKELIKSHLTKSTTNKQDIKYTSIQEQHSHSKTVHVLHEALKLMPHAIYFYLCELSLQLSMTAVLPTITFPNSPFPPRDHYQYYRLVNDIGYFLGGIEHAFISCFCSQRKNLVQIQKLWIPMSLHIGCLLLFLLISWYRFLSNVYVMLLVVFILGVLQGTITVNSIGLVTNLFTNAADKANAIIFVEASSAVGSLAAGLLGLFVEIYLREHCTNRLLLGRYCLARHSTSRGWSTNELCK